MHCPQVIATAFVQLAYTTSTDSKAAWMFVRNDAACDTSAGEVKLKQSPGKSPSLEACQRSCEAAADCQSITFSNAGLCSHFSTACSKIEQSNGAISLRLSSGSESNSSPNASGRSGELRLACRGLAVYVSVTALYTDSANHPPS